MHNLTAFQSTSDRFSHDKMPEFQTGPGSYDPEIQEGRNGGSASLKFSQPRFAGHKGLYHTFHNRTTLNVGQVFLRL